MTVDPDIWEPGSGPLGGPAVANDDLFRRFENAYGVRLPELFRQMYRLQNGGTLRDVPSVDCFRPLSAAGPSYGHHICSLQVYAEAGAMLWADDLDWLEEEVGNPKLIFPLTCDGHRCYALDYNRRQPDGEPAVIHLDFECGGTEYVARSFSAWIEQLTRDDPHCAVDWNEHRQYTLIHSETLTVDSPWEEPSEHIEQVLCRDGSGGLLLFTHTETGHRVQLERVHLPRGLNSMLVDVEPFRRQPEPTFQLHLEPAAIKDIHWTSSRKTHKGTWKNERTDGVPVYCTVESKSRERLEQLARRLTPVHVGLVRRMMKWVGSGMTRGIVRGIGWAASRWRRDDPLELDPKFLRDLDQLDQMVAEGLKQLMTPEAESKTPLPTEPPAPGPAPDAMTEDEIVEELTGLILHFVGQVPKVHSEDDAQRLIDGFATHRPRYIELYRALYAAGPTHLMRLLPAERVGQEAMNALLQRNSAAYLRLDAYGRENVSEALQPKRRDPRVQKLLERYLRATAQLADLLENVNRDNNIALHQTALEAAIAEYADCDRRFCKLVRQLHTLEPAVAHRKRIQSEAFASLQRHWNELRTRHRDLYKAHRELFDALPDYLV
jgi:hypothetical protein